MPKAKRGLAEEISKGISYLNRLKGILCWKDQALWLIQVMSNRELKSSKLAYHLQEQTFPDLTLLAECLEAKVHPLQVKNIATAHYMLKKIGSASSIEKLASEGIPALRKYRSLDFSEFLKSATENLPLLEQALAASESLLNPKSNVEDPKVWHSQLYFQSNVLGDVSEKKRSEWQQATHLHIDLLIKEIHLNTSLPALVWLSLYLKNKPEHEQIKIYSKLSQKNANHCQQILQSKIHDPAWLLLSIYQPNLKKSLRYLQYIPRQRREEFSPLADRLRILYGPINAWRILWQTIRFWGQTDLEEKGFAAFQKFQRLVTFSQENQSKNTLSAKKALQKSERYILEKLEQLPSLRNSRTKAFLQIWKEWLQAKSLPNYIDRTKDLLRSLNTLRSNDLLKISNKLYEHWTSHQKKEQHQQTYPIHETLALGLMAPHLHLQWPRSLSSSFLHVLRIASSKMETQRLLELWPALLKAERSDLEHYHQNISQSRQPNALLKKAILNIPVYLLPRFKETGSKSLSRYIEFVEQASPQFKAQNDIKSNWLIKYFINNQDKTSNLLTLLSKGILSKGKNKEVFLFSLSLLLQKDAAFREKIARSEHLPENQDSPYVAELSKALQVEKKMLEKYLHLQGLNGEKEQFSRLIKGVLFLQQKNDDEQDRIHEKMQQKEISSEEKDKLSKRLTFLNDQTLQKERNQNIAKRCRNRLCRSLEKLQHDYLQKVFQEHTREVLLDWVKAEQLPKELPERVYSSLHLLSSDEPNHDLLKRVLKSSLKKTPLSTHPENQKWLQEAAQNGVNVEHWQKGFHGSISKDGHLYKSYTEKDPLEVLQMGSYFGTCLSLEDGCYSSSTLTNALDINKHVIYLKNQKGSIIGRQLIGATKEGKLAKYRLYQSTKSFQIETALEKQLASFAKDCGLTLSNHETPETLHQGDWYDDQNSKWSPSLLEKKTSTEQIHHPLLSDFLAHWEYQFEHAKKKKGAEQKDLFKKLISQRNYDVSINFCFWDQLSHEQAQKEEAALWEVKYMLLQKGQLNWIYAQQARGNIVYGSEQRLRKIATELNRPDRKLIDQTLAYAQQTAKLAKQNMFDENDEYFSIIQPNGFFQTCRPQELLRFYLHTKVIADYAGVDERYRGFQKSDEESWIQNASKMLFLSYIRHGFPKKQPKFPKQQKKLFEQIFRNISTMLPFQMFRTTLLKRLQSSDHQNLESDCLAVGMLSQTQDSQSLLKAFQQNSNSLPIATAIHRSSPETWEQSAKHLWFAGSKQSEAFSALKSFDSFVELNSPELAEQLYQKALQFVQENQIQKSPPKPQRQQFARNLLFLAGHSAPKTEEHIEEIISKHKTDCFDPDYFCRGFFSAVQTLHQAILCSNSQMHKALDKKRPFSLHTIVNLKSHQELHIPKNILTSLNLWAKALEQFRNYQQTYHVFKAEGTSLIPVPQSLQTIAWFALIHGEKEHIQAAFSLLLEVAPEDSLHLNLLLPTLEEKPEALSIHLLFKFALQLLGIGKNSINDAKIFLQMKGVELVILLYSRLCSTTNLNEWKEILEPLKKCFEELVPEHIPKEHIEKFALILQNSSSNIRGELQNQIAQMIVSDLNISLEPKNDVSWRVYELITSLAAPKEAKSFRAALLQKFFEQKNSPELWIALLIGEKKELYAEDYEYCTIRSASYLLQEQIIHEVYPKLCLEAQKQIAGALLKQEQVHPRAAWLLDLIQKGEAEEIRRKEDFTK